MQIETVDPQIRELLKLPVPAFFEVRDIKYDESYRHGMQFLKIKIAEREIVKYEFEFNSRLNDAITYVGGRELGINFFRDTVYELYIFFERISNKVNWKREGF